MIHRVFLKKNPHESLFFKKRKWHGLFVNGVSQGELVSQQEKGVTQGWVFSCPSWWQTSKCLMDIYAWHGESTSELNLFCPPFHGLANAFHFHETDKSVQVKRLSIKLLPPDSVQAHPGECRTLTRKVNKLLAFFLAESADLLRNITFYIMMIIEIIMPCYGLYSQAKGRTIPASQGIAQATGVLQPELGLVTCRKASPPHLPPVIKEVLCFSFVCVVSLKFTPIKILSPQRR